MAISSIGVMNFTDQHNALVRLCVVNDIDIVIIDREVTKIKALISELIAKIEVTYSGDTMRRTVASDAQKRIHATKDMTQLADCDLVVIAVGPEKRDEWHWLEELEGTLAPTAIIAITSAYSSIAETAGRMRYPTRLVGIHPVYGSTSDLMEVIRHPNTDIKVFDAVRALVEHIGAVAVESADFPPFLTNRILLAFINEAAFTLHEKVATIEAIDTAMRLGINVPLGPLRLADEIGLDECLAGLNKLYQDFGSPRHRPCPLLVKYVDAGWLGKKSGRGFYSYRASDERVRLLISSVG